MTKWPIFDHVLFFHGCLFCKVDGLCFQPFDLIFRILGFYILFWIRYFLLFCRLKHLNRFFVLINYVTQFKMSRNFHTFYFKFVWLVILGQPFPNARNVINKPPWPNLISALWVTAKIGSIRDTMAHCLIIVHFTLIDVYS